MGITADDKIIRRDLRLSKKWVVKNFTREVPDKNWKSSTVKDLLKKFDKTGDVQHYPRSGRLRTVCVPDNIVTVEDLIRSQENDDTNASPQEIERRTDISRWSVRRIAKNNECWPQGIQKEGTSTYRKSEETDVL